MNNVKSQFKNGMDLRVTPANGVPSINDLINNSRKDTPITIAHMMVSIEKLAITDGNNKASFTLDESIKGEYLDTVTDLSNKNYSFDKSTSEVVEVTDGGANIVLYGDSKTVPYLANSQIIERIEVNL